MDSDRPQYRPAIGLLPRRQVHLDFHTSELIPEVGGAFNEKDFQHALQLGRVNSVTLFAKCHHSWSYYPTKIGRPHPNLATNLLGRQIAACRAIGVRCPVYYTVGWSANDAIEHPEWCVRDRSGAIATCNADLAAAPTADRPIVSWVHLCPAAPGYRQLILDQTRELCEMFDLDGLFYDICFNTPTCYCDTCREGMAAENIDLDDLPAVQAYRLRVWHAFMSDVRSILHGHHPTATLFFNGSASPTTPPATLDLQTHLELEDLPTTWGGYDKFPLRSRFFAPSGRQIIAMSGKFHTTWGEFGGFKSPDAMRFEVASMAAFGAGCNFGDQLHPSGRTDRTTYRNIGHAFEYAERIEPYSEDALPTSNLAIWPSQQTGSADAAANDQGVANMLMEGQYSFEVVARPESVDLKRFDTIILTGNRCLNAHDAARINRFVKDGGALIVLNESVFGLDDGKPIIDIGADYRGPANFKIDYTLPLAPIATEAMTSPFLNYAAAPRFVPTSGTPLGQVFEPYFDRTYGQYCSHQNTPNRPEPAEHVAAVRNGRVICLAHPLGRIYHDHGARLHRDFFLRCLAELHRKPMVRSTMPSAGRVSLLHQPQLNRYVLHLLYAPPMQRGRCIVIEDQVPLHDVRVTLNLPHRPRCVEMPLRNEQLSIKRGPDGDVLHLPPFASHEIVTISY